MRADRLISILLLLQNNGRMTAKDLAGKLEVSARTIHRDMEALSAAGIPVVAERGTSGGWSLTEGYRTSLTGMKSEEMQSLLLAQPSRIIADLGMRGVFENAVQKLLAAFPSAFRQDAETVRQRIHIDGAGWHQSSERFPLLSVVQEAIWEEKQLHMLYPRGEETVERVVEPLGLVAKSGIWYLVATAEGELRTYRISRLQSARMLDSPFDRPEPFDLAEYWEKSTEQFKASLPRFSAKIKIREKEAERLAKQRYVRFLETYPAKEGFIEADVEFHTIQSACEILLGYGRSVEVVSPAELRKEIYAEANAIVSLYASAGGAYDKEL